MKLFRLALPLLILCTSPNLRAAQDAATEERLNQLSGKIETLLEGQEALRKRLNELARDIENVRDQASKPTANYATSEDLKRLADSVKEIDRKRVEDAEKVQKELSKIARDVINSTHTPPKTSNPRTTDKTESTEKTARPQTGFEYTIQSGDTISAIINAYRDKNIKITQEQILKANPGLKPERLVVGKKIFIPAPEK
jgi:TolA-binding protein